MTKRVLKVLSDGSERITFGEVIWREKPARNRARRHEWKFSFELLRLREIETVVRSRHGSAVPDPEDTDDRETCLAYIKAAAFALSGQCIVSWAAKWAPWAREDEVNSCIALAAARRRAMKADGVAGLLMVTMAERTALCLRTIGACDLSKDDRVALSRERKRERDRNRKAAARKADGKKDRASYEAQSLSSLKPWESEGLSRPTWYRRQRETGMARVVIVTKGDTLVSSISHGEKHSLSERDFPPTPPPVPRQTAGRIVGMRGSPETQFLAEVQEAEPHGRRDRKSERAV